MFKPTKIASIAHLVRIGEHQLPPGFAHVPLDVIRKHAEEDVRGVGCRRALLLLTFSFLFRLAGRSASARRHDWNWGGSRGAHR